MSMTLPILRAAANHIVASTPANLANLGLDQQDFDRVIGVAPWTGQYRVKNVDTLRRIGEACLISQGIASFEKPAEYTAALIAIFVKPVNWQLACAYFANTVVAHESLMQAEGALLEGYEPCSAGKLFSLVLALSEDSGYPKAIEQYHRTVQAKFELSQGASTQRAGGAK